MTDSKSVFILEEAFENGAMDILRKPANECLALAGQDDALK